MQSIHITAAITTLAALAIFGTWIIKLKLPANERLLLLAFFITIPLEPLSYYAVRLPIDHFLAAALGRNSDLYQWLFSLYAPLTEEPFKLIPLLIPAIRRDIRTENFARYALAIGLGFAIGEMWFLADLIAQSRKLGGVPFYEFSGYFVERLMTCLFHSAFVALALWQLRTRFILGFAAAAAAHWLGNFPILLLVWNVGGLGPVVWTTIIQVWLGLFLLGSLALLSHFILGRFAPGAMIFGQRHCPECACDYDAPIVAFNFGTTRYERCPHCKHWHWVR